MKQKNLAPIMQDLYFRVNTAMWIKLDIRDQAFWISDFGQHKSQAREPGFYICWNLKF
jgi:hypothetical protein